LDDDFEKKQYTLSGDARQQKKNEINDKKIDFKRFVEDSERELDKMQKDLLEPIHARIFDCIKDYGQANGFTVIFERSMLVYANAAFDISNEIVKLFDKQSSNPKTTAPAK